MKKLFYLIYGLVFRAGRLLPVKNNLVVLVSPHNASLNDSLGEVRNELMKRGNYEFYVIDGSDIRGQKSPKSIFRFFVAGPLKLARAHYIFLNDNFMPMASLNFRKSAVVTQLWHGEGALKKICLSLDLPADIVEREKRLYEKYTYIICSSEKIVPVWAKAFGKEEKDVLPLGSPRTDAFLREFDYAAKREEFDSLYPRCRGKKLLLYAPTFRDNPEQDRLISQKFDVQKFNARFGSEYALLVRLHPQVHSCRFGDGAADVTGYPDINTLLHLADVLVTDYSSVFMNYVLLYKPVVFYAYDLEDYAGTRQFYGDYKSIVPGPVAQDFDTLLDNISAAEVDKEKYGQFIDYHLGACDGSSARRVADRIVPAES